jgi:hypothetical protein
VTTSFDVTRGELVLGARNLITGWYIPHYNLSTIKMIIYPKGTNISNIEAGQITRYNNTGLTSAVVAEGDQITNKFNEVFQIIAVDAYQLGDNFDHYNCQLETLPLENLISNPYSLYAYSVAISAESATYRTKVWLETFLVNTYLPSFIVGYAYPSAYPLTRVFKDEAVDLIFSISSPDSTATFQGDKSYYGFEETIPITISAVDKDVKGQVIIDQAESELRRLCDEHVYGSIRLMKLSKPKTVRQGIFTIYSSDFSITYRRVKAQ